MQDMLESEPAVSRQLRVRALLQETRRSCSESHHLREESARTRKELHVALSSLKNNLALLVTSIEESRLCRKEDGSSVVAKRPEADAPLPSLTPREIQVLRLIGEGHRTKEIAARLNITFKTVVSHKTHIMDKLEIHDVLGLVRYAIRTGLCKP
jgi:DNA-binding NarL/FixJ family response regulator